MPPRVLKPIDADKAWADLFQKALVRRKEPEGKGWLTYPQIRKKMGCGANKAHKFIRSAVRSGQMERFAGLKTMGNKAVREVWYRPMALASPKGVKTP